MEKPRGTAVPPTCTNYEKALADFLLKYAFLIPSPEVLRGLLQQRTSRVVLVSPQARQSFECPVNLCVRDQIPTDSTPKSPFYRIPFQAGDNLSCSSSSSSTSSCTLFSSPKTLIAPVGTIPQEAGASTTCRSVKRALGVEGVVGATSAPPLKRSKTGWKGLPICAACRISFSRMSELNHHYALQHKNLLQKAWTAAFLKKQRRASKPSQRRYSNWAQSLLAPTPNPSHGHHTDKASRKSHHCPSCNYCAKWPTELQKHIVVHASSRPFACIICAKCYKWSWDLGRHFSSVHVGLPNPYKMSKLSSSIGGGDGLCEVQTF